jgi:hypothetical protein
MQAVVVYGLRQVRVNEASEHEASMSDTGSSSASASSRITDAFSLAAQKPGGRRHRHKNWPS